MSLKIGHVWSKTRSNLRKTFECSLGHIFSPIVMELGQNVYLDEILDEFKMGHVRSKTRSLGQTLEKPCVCSGGQIFSPIIMKLCQNICLMKPQTSSKIGHVGS